MRLDSSEWSSSTIPSEGVVDILGIALRLGDDGKLERMDHQAQLLRFRHSRLGEAKSAMGQLLLTTSEFANHYRPDRPVRRRAQCLNNKARRLTDHLVGIGGRIAGTRGRSGLTDPLETLT
jgi:hypothetical protein